MGLVCVVLECLFIDFLATQLNSVFIPLVKVGLMPSRFQFHPTSAPARGESGAECNSTH
jgi:hypothetical protein